MKLGMHLLLLFFALLNSPAMATETGCTAELLNQILGGDGLPVREQVDATHYRFYDPDDLVPGFAFRPRFKFFAEVNDRHILELNIASREGERISKRIYARKMFDEMMEHFAKENTEIEAIQGLWVHGTNLGEVNRLTQNGTSLKRAVRETWTAKQAARYGYTDVKIVGMSGESGKYIAITVQFKKSRKSRFLNKFFNK